MYTVYNFIIEIYSRDGGKHAIEATFCFIPISQIITKIYRFKVSIMLNIAQQSLWMKPWPTLFLGNAYYVFLGIASATCLEFGIGQRNEERAKGPSTEQGCI